MEASSVSTTIRIAFGKGDTRSPTFYAPRRPTRPASCFRQFNDSKLSQNRTACPSASTTSVCSSTAPLFASTTSDHVRDIVIVGGGIAGLSTALGLHRLGMECVLLEQSEELTANGGSSLSIWNNAWKALEYLGVADSLREKFVKLSGLEIYSLDGSCLANLDFKNASRDIEFRAVERKALLEALKEPLPDSMVVYDAKVIGIKKVDKGLTELECENGYRIKTKVLIGCDGSRSIVARWMGFREPQLSGYIASRGLVEFSEGHNLRPVAQQIIGEGVRSGLLPIDQNKAYWFVVFNSPATGEKVRDPERVKMEALSYVSQGWPDATVVEAIKRTRSENIVRRSISDRWMWPVGGPAFQQGGVTLAGDAMHPMTPNLGQGGCCALEDSVVLARALHKGMNGSQDEIEQMLRAYTEVRWRRMLPLAIRSRAIGAILQQDNGLFCSLRNFLMPKIVRNAEQFSSHAFYDCGSLDCSTSAP